MKHSTLLTLLVLLSFSLNSCSFIKKLFPGKQEEAPSVTFELIDKLRIAYEDGRIQALEELISIYNDCLLYTSPSPRDRQKSRMPSSA